jgi:hypothetical protein
MTRFASLRGTKQSRKQTSFMSGLLRCARNDVPAEKNKKNNFFLDSNEKSRTFAV